MLEAPCAVWISQLLTIALSITITVRAAKLFIPHEASTRKIAAKRVARKAHIRNKHSLGRLDCLRQGCHMANSLPHRPEGLTIRNAVHVLAVCDPFLAQQ